jgi:probable phosphoglycerate mutase
MAKLIFARHGESEANVLHEFSNRGLKHGLTARGRLQAQLLAEQLGDSATEALFSSPLLRALQTAEILSTHLNLPYEVTDALREYDCGFLEGRSDEDGWELYEIVLREWLVNRNWARRIQGGESFLDMQRRFVPFIEDLVTAYASAGATLVFVGHGGLYRCMLPLILRNIDFDFTLNHGLGNTETVVAEAMGRELICRAWGPISFG